MQKICKWALLSACKMTLELTYGNMWYSFKLLIAQLVSQKFLKGRGESKVMHTLAWNPRMRHKADVGDLKKGSR